MKINSMCIDKGKEEERDKERTTEEMVMSYESQAPQCFVMMTFGA